MRSRTTEGDICCQHLASAYTCTQEHTHTHKYEDNEGLSLHPFNWNLLLLCLVLWKAQYGEEEAQTIVRNALGLGMVSSLRREATFNTRHSYKIIRFQFLSLWGIGGFIQETEHGSSDLTLWSV